MGARRREAAPWLIAGLPIALFLLLPIVLLLARGFSSAQLLGERSALDALGLSAWTSLCSLALIVLFGIPLAWGLSQSPAKKWRWLEGLLELPIVTPPAVAGIGLLLAFGRQGPFGLSVAFTPIAVVLAQVFVGAPFFLRSATLGFRSVSPEAIESAKVSGIGQTALLAKVAAPLAKGNLIAGAAMAWARAVGEFGATILFAGNLQGKTQTAPLAIYSGFEEDLNSAVAIGLPLLLGAFLVLWVVKILEPTDAS